MTNQEPDSLTGAFARFTETTIERLIEVLRSVDSTEDAAEQLRRRVADLEDLGGRLRLAVVAILSHAIRRQHLPQVFTFDSELWTRLRDLGGEEACSALNLEIDRSRALLLKSDATTKNGIDVCDL
jgi:hypothetical protein